MTITVASNNAHKISEIRTILQDQVDINLRSMGELGYTEEIIEDGKTFAENALIKARAVRNFTGTAVIADDSGLCVDYLNGEPGIFSARYRNLNSDLEKNQSILKSLKGAKEKERGARFVCVITYIDQTGVEHLFEGRCEGRIASEEAGGGGFGYDPIFIPSGYSCTIAELPGGEKNQISHRGKALMLFQEYLQSCS